MVDFWNFNGSWILVEHNWVWVLVALAFGAWCGWTTSARDSV